MPHPPSTRVSRLHKILLHRPVVATLFRACQQTGGTPVHLVGGLLRDRLLGLPSRDYDAVVAGHGREVAAHVAEALGAHLVHLGGKDFAAYRVVGGEGDDWVLDVWDRENMSLEDDLRRRDFTVNSFALPLHSGSISADPVAGRDGDGPARFVDPFGGVADLERRLLRATTDASFSGDPLRVLRLPRLLVQLPGFTADPATLELARRAAPGLAAVAAERVREELVLIFQRRGAHRAFGLLTALGLYPGLWRGEPGVAATAAGERRAGRALLELERLAERSRELAELARISHRVSSREGEGARECKAQGESTPQAYCKYVEDGDRPVTQQTRADSYSQQRAGERCGQVSPAPRVDLLATRYAVTFAHLPRDEGTATERAAASVAAVERFRDAGYLTRNLAARVSRLVGETALPDDRREQRRFLHRLGELWPAAVVLLGARIETGGATGGDLDAWRRRVRALAALVRDDGERILDPPRLVGGQQVQELLGWEPGPRVGEALAAVERAQVDGDVASREEALELLRRRFGSG